MNQFKKPMTLEQSLHFAGSGADCTYNSLCDLLKASPFAEPDSFSFEASIFATALTLISVRHSRLSNNVKEALTSRIVDGYCAALSDQCGEDCSEVIEERLKSYSACADPVDGAVLRLANQFVTNLDMSAKDDVAQFAGLALFLTSSLKATIKALNELNDTFSLASN